MTLIDLLHTANRGSEDRAENRIQGVVTGIVRDIKDPDGLGRVRVVFPWLAEESEDTVSIEDDDRAHSYWARMATMMAGPERGSYFIPEVDDEVLVAFEHGELDRPYVVGVLWNTDDRPPETMDDEGKNDIRAIHTRSGHMIVFNDSDEEPAIRIEDNTGANFINIDSSENAMAIEVGGDLTINAGGAISITAGGDITIDTQANMNATAAQNGSVRSTGPLELTSDAQVTVEGAVRAEVTAATVAVDGSGVTEIKGGIVKIN